MFAFINVVFIIEDYINLDSITWVEAVILLVWGLLHALNHAAQSFGLFI